MHRRTLVVVGIAVAVVGALLASLALQPSGAPSSQSLPASTRTQSPTNQQPEPTAPATSVTPGSYVDYSGTAIADAQGRTFLFFHAPWCPQCRSVEADIVSRGVPDGVTIIKVDYDSNQGLRQQYGVTLQTTFVEVDASGRGLQSFVAYEDPRLAAVLDAML